MEQFNTQILEEYRKASKKDRKKFMRKSKELDNKLIQENNGLKGFLARFFNHNSSYSTKIHKEINQSLKRIKQEQALKERLFKEKIQSNDYLIDFFYERKIPNKYEFYSIKNTMNDLSKTMNDRLDNAISLIKKITLKTSEEMNYVKELKTVVREDLRKGYLAHCIEYNGLSEDKVLSFVREINSCLKRYFLENINIAF